MRLFGKTTVWVGLTVLFAAIALGQGQRGGGQQPQQGKVILERACSTCHPSEAITNYHFETADEYKDIVNSMIGSGAQVSQQELPVLVDYLFATYGKKKEAPAAPAAGAPAAGAADPGKAILEAACTVCHGLDGLANHQYTSKEPYQSLVANMVAYGASVSDAQMGPLVDYMFKTYGKK